MPKCVCQGTGMCRCPQTTEEYSVENGRVVKKVTTVTDLGAFDWKNPTNEQNEESKGPEFLTESK